MPVPHDAPKRIGALMQQCMVENPDERPSMDDVVRKIDSVRESDASDDDDNDNGNEDGYGLLLFLFFSPKLVFLNIYVS